MSVHVVFDADWGDAAKPLPADIIVIIIIIINHSLWFFFFQLKEINCYFFVMFTPLYIFFLKPYVEIAKRK